MASRAPVRVSAPVPTLAAIFLMLGTATAAASSFPLSFFIGFPEKLIILTNVHVVGVQLERPFVLFVGEIELARLLVGNPEVVAGACVRRIELYRLLPSINRLAPEADSGNFDSEFDFLLGNLFGFLVGERRTGEG